MEFYVTLLLSTFQLTEFGVILFSGAAGAIKLHVAERSRVCRDLFSLGHIHQPLSC
jgi:hypothetical protein